MSLTGYTDLSTTFASIGKTFTDSVSKGSTSDFGVTASASQGKIKTNSLIAYDATTKSQVNDWISFLKISASAGGVTVSSYSMIHLISWQSNLTPAKDSSLA